MKVGIVNFNSLNRKQLNNPYVQNNKNAASSLNLTSISNQDTYNFSLIKKSEISFESSRLPFYKMNDIPCPCCGRIMVPISVFSARLTEKVLSGSSKKAIRVLSKFKKNMHKTENLCFKKIKESSEKSPNKTLNQIVNGFREKSRKHLNANQFKTLKEIDELGKELSVESEQKLRELTDRSRFLILTDQPDNFFKRKTFIKKIFKLTEEFPEKEIGEKIYKKSLELNTSENDINAFMVKYSQRSSSEIGQRLVSKSVSTIEHIKPQADNGENCVKNYILECAGCNNSRNETPLDEWIKNAHPEMTKNTQKHMDIIIDLINKNKVKDFVFYPAQVAQTLETESKGLIKLDISRLKQTPKKTS